MNAIRDKGVAKEESAPISRRQRPAFIAVIAILLGLGGLIWHFHYQKGTHTLGHASSLQMPLSTVAVDRVAIGDMPVTLAAIGTVTPLATVTVRVQVTGVLQQIRFTEGEHVSSGQVLAIIDPSPFEMALMQATGQRQRDIAQLENARLTLQRYRTLASLDSIAKQDVDTQDALVRQLEGAVVADRAAEGIAQLNLGYTKILSPTTGQIGLRNVDVGNLVSPTDANGIAVITQLKPIDVVFSIPQDRISEVVENSHRSTGMRVTVLDRTHFTVLEHGKFFTLDNEVDVQTGTVRAKARFENVGENLFPNQFVNIELLLRTIPNAILVPIEAVRQSSNGDYVYVFNRATQTVDMRHIVHGVATTRAVQVLSGLQAGEVIVTEGGDRLKSGDRVRIRSGSSS